MHNIDVREIGLNDEQVVQRAMSRDKISVNWESVPTAGFMGLLLAVATFVIGKCFWETDIGILYSLVVGGAIGTALGVYNERRRIRLIPAEEKRWHAEYVALCGEIEKFSERLEAFRKLAVTLDRTQEIDRAVIAKYQAERDSLAERMRVFLRAMALKRYEEAVLKTTDSRFRDTRDVSEQVFVNRVRVEQSEAEIRALTAKDESPNEAEFRRLEARFREDDDDAAPASSRARRMS